MKLAFPKPERRSTTKRRAQRVKGLSRRQCREVVYRRAHWHCERCGQHVTLDCWPSAPERAHVHEIVPRSLGGSPTDPNNCQLLCHYPCHLEAHRLRVAQEQKPS